MQAFGFIGIHMVIIGIQLQTCIQLIIDIYMEVRLSHMIKVSWQAYNTEWPLLRSGSCVTGTLFLKVGADLLGCINHTREKARKKKHMMKQ